jgi:hypothetical protein
MDPFAAPASAHPSSEYGSGRVSAGVGSDIASEAPRPIGVDPSVTGSFQRLSSGQGAVIPTRDNAASAAEAARSSLQAAPRPRVSTGRAPRPVQRIQTDRRLFVVLGIVAVVIVVVLFVLFRNAYESTGSDAASTTQVEQTQVSADSTVDYGGYVYGVAEQADGTYALQRTAEGSSTPLVLAQLDGTPVALVLYDGVFLVPQNRSDSTWDVLCYVMGDGSIPTQLIDADGATVGGSGSISSATLDGSNLLLTDAGGKQTKADLTKLTSGV